MTSSDAPWTHVPDGWELQPLLAVASENQARNAGMVENNLLSLSYGRIVRKDIEGLDGLLPASFETYQVVEPGDVVCRFTDLQNDKRSLRTALVNERGIITSAYTALKPRCLPRWMSYLLRAYDYQKVFYGFGGGVRQSLKFADVKRLPILLPPESEQHSIADFLDRETAQIDSMVDAQERLVALLEERRRTFLTHAVLAATSAGARVDSGLSWLGPIPATWELKPLKYLIDHMDQGWSPQCESYPVEGPDEWGVLKAGCVNGGVFRPQENKKLPEDLEPRPITTLKSGDIVISRANTRDLVGSAAVIEHDHPRLMLSDKLYRMRLTDSAMPGYVAMVLGADPYREQMELAAGGASHSMQNIARSDIVNLPVPVPPLDVQDRIVREVTDVEAHTRSMISSAQKSIALMKERRAALISAAVTGRIDVRTGIEQVERDLEEARV